MRHEFLPAIGPYVTEVRKAPKAWRYPIHWLNKDPAEIHYPYALASYALWRDSMPFPFSTEDVTIFSDSGGYTYVTDPDYSASPTDVIRWQIRNSTRGVMFDCPPYRPGSAIQFTGSAAEWFPESIDLSMRNVRRALPLYEKHKTDRAFGGVRPFHWWGVVQGEEWNQMDEWHDKIAQIYPFDLPLEGWALAPKPSTDLLSCTRYLRFAHEKKIRNVHLLQVTADRVVALVMSLAQMAGTFELVTYDSASALRCAINRSAIIPDGFGQQYIKESRTVQVDELCSKCQKIGTECSCHGNENTVHQMMMGCPCYACRNYREFYPHSNAEFPHIILLHNHLAMVRSFDMMWEVAQKEPDRLLRWATGKMYGEVLREWDRSHSGAKTQRKAVSLMDRIA